MLVEIETGSKKCAKQTDRGRVCVCVCSTRTLGVRNVLIPHRTDTQIEKRRIKETARQPPQHVTTKQVTAAFFQRAKSKKPCKNYCTHSHTIACSTHFRCFAIARFSCRACYSALLVSHGILVSSRFRNCVAFIASVAYSFITIRLLSAIFA